MEEAGKRKGAEMKPQDAKFFIIKDYPDYECLKGKTQFPAIKQVVVTVDGKERNLDLFESAKGGIPVYIELER